MSDPSRTDDERIVRELDQAWNDVYLQNERGRFAEILAADFRATFSDGRTAGRSELMEPTDGRKLTFSEFGIEMFGPTAVTRGRVVIEHPEGPVAQRFVRVYSRRDDQWRAVAVYVFPLDE